MSNNKQKRKYNKIQYSKQVRQQNIKNKRGSEQETASLNINLKTLNKTYLNTYTQENQQPEELQIIYAYIHHMRGSFQSTRNLFGGNENHQYHQRFYQNIRNYMLSVYSSTGFISSVFLNEKMDFKSKLMFIKFLQKIRSSTINPRDHRYWKQKI